MRNVEGETFKTLGGLEIQFPYRGYGVQKSMMVHITRTLMNKEHSLIESPTGTGKTLVLLCSTLAWLKKSKELGRPFMSPRMLENIAKERLENLENSRCTCGRRPNQFVNDLNDGKEGKKGKSKMLDEESTADSWANGEFNEKSEYFSPCKPQGTTNKGDVIMIPLDDENESPTIVEDDEVEIIDLTDECVVKKIGKPQSEKGEKIVNDEKISDNKPSKECKTCLALKIEKEFASFIGGAEGQVVPNQYKKIPKIYYGTRTHKQVSQVIRELNKSIYKKNLRMCILSSRERTCINEEVRSLPHRDEECLERLKARSDKNSSGPSCAYKIDNLQTVFEGLNDDYTDKAWDIEEVNKWSREKGVCPFFGNRSLQEEADITFCPYNYLLDPRIRRSLNINLKNSIIVLDEAHNIEDICRDSASFILDSKQIDEIINKTDQSSSHYIQGSAMSDAFHYFREKFLGLRIKFSNFEFGPQAETSRDFVAREIFTQSDMMKYLNGIGLGPNCLDEMKKNISILREDDKSSDKPSNSQDNISLIGEIQYISQLTGVLEFMYSSDKQNIDDYRCVITKSLNSGKATTPRRPKKNRASEPEIVNQATYVTRLSILCMSPGIAFKKIHTEAWSVLVASGTLSPIESIQSELGCDFVKPFQGGHVIPNDRVIATVLTHGPSGYDLNCSFTNSISLKFQDEVGLVVRDVCRTVPNGVLCFFPSYDRLEGLYQRWNSKGYIGEIKKMKAIYLEQKNKTPDEFELELTKYNVNAKGKGALLLAVYRGKVSEGIDFSDSAARAVITIGIPYPNVKEITIGLKRDYNDIARRSKPYLLPGRDWYSSQAFRALNQAVGRCIRHREDWGAIIMIDSRLKVGDGVDSKISKWLRQLIYTSRDYGVVRDCLENFITNRLGEECNRNKKIKLEDS